MKSKRKHRRALQVLLLLVALLLVLPGQRVRADELAGCAGHYRHIDWETTTPQVCIWATDVTLTAAEVAQGQAVQGVAQCRISEWRPPLPNSSANLLRPVVRGGEIPHEICRRN